MSSLLSPTFACAITVEPKQHKKDVLAMTRVTRRFRHIISIVIAGSSCALSAFAQEVEVCSTSHGRVIISGTDIAPPYRLGVTNAALTINGLRPRVESKDAPQPSDLALARYAVKQRARSVAESLGVKPTEPASLRHIAAVFGESGQVDSVKANGAMLAVWWRGDRTPELFSYDFTPRQARAPHAERLRNDANLLCQVLEKGGIVILGVGQQVIVPRERVQAVLEEITQVRQGQKLAAKASYLPRAIHKELRSPATMRSLQDR